MPRSNWKGVISFGLVSIPVELYNSENRAEKPTFHQIDKRNNARIQYKRVNAETGREVDWENIVKGYAYNKDTILPVKEGELEKVAGDNARTIAIEEFVKKNSIDFIDVDKTYYLVPDKKGEKGYVILREVLKKENAIGIAKVILSTKEYTAAISVYEDALVLYLLRYQDDIRPISEFDIPTDNLKKYKISAKEINAAALLVKSMTVKWKPEKYKDEYQRAVHKWAENKIKHKGAVVMSPRAKHAAKKGKEVDFINLLKRSLAQGKKGKTTKPAAHVKRKPHNGKRATLH